MPAGAEAGELLVDTSVAVAVSVAAHEHHEPTAAALRGATLGLSGHATFETYSVLTRLPPPARRDPSAIARLLAESFPATRWLSDGATERLLPELAGADIAGGSVYDALVAAAAREHGLPLVTRDRRAIATYRRLGVELVILD
jgi:predicted nucleic acid-binding protein